MQIKIDTSGIERAVRDLGSAAARQIPYATARALTGVAKKSQQVLKQKIGSAFNNATPWIKNGAFITPARTNNLEAVVGIKDQGARATQADYLKEHFNSGARGNKPMEKALRAMGILPAGWLAVPSSSGVQLDAYGNVSKSTLGRILRALTQKQTATKGGVSARLFVIKPGARSRLAPGIWSATRAGDQQTIKPVFLFVHSATYNKVIDLEKIVGEVVRSEFESEFMTAFDHAMRTAR